MITTCSSCRFARPYSADFLLFECRRRSPSTDPHVPFPITYPQNWCGEWESTLSATQTMSESEIEQLFRQWWSSSYPTPPGPHALMTHTSWAAFLLRHIAMTSGSPALSTPEVER